MRLGGRERRFLTAFGMTNSIYGATRAAAAEDEEEERAKHGEVGAGVADHEPEPLMGMGEFGEFGSGVGGRDN